MVYALPRCVDWQFSIRPAVFELLAGCSPNYLDLGIQGLWEQYVFFNAAWALLPLILLVLLPVQVRIGLLAIVSLVSFAYVAHRLGGKPLAVGLLLVSPRNT